MVDEPLTLSPAITDLLIAGFLSVLVVIIAYMMIEMVIKVIKLIKEMIR